MSMSRRTINQNRREYEIMLAYMVNKYPSTFFPSGVPPRALKIGILHDIIADNPDVPKRQIRRFLGGYTRKNRYLRALIDNVFRIRLDGTADVPVHVDNKTFAAAMLAGRKAEAKAAA